MSESTLPEGVLWEALSMIDISQWGSVRVQLLALIRAREVIREDGWACVSPERAAEELGRNRNWVLQLLGGGRQPGYLWKVERVVIARHRRGPQGSLFRINPAIGNWRAVPWTERNPERRRLRLLRALYADQAGVLFPRSYTAELAGPAPRSHTAEKTKPIPRSYTAESPALQGPQFRGKGAAELGFANSAVRDRGDSDLAEPPDTILLRSKDLSLEAQRESDEIVERLCEALEARTAHRGGWVGGQYRNKLAELATGHEPSAILSAIASAPGSMGVPAIVDSWLPKSLAGDRAVVHRPNRADLQQKVVGLQRLVDVYEAEGGEPPVGLQEELVACQTELETFQESTV